MHWHALVWIILMIGLLSSCAAPPQGEVVPAEPTSPDTLQDTTLVPPKAGQFPIPPGSPVTKDNWISVAQAADFVVAGKVDNISSYYGMNEYGFELILSDVTVDVSSVLSGKQVEQLIFTVEGGTVGDTTLYVSSTPQFEIGATYVFLLSIEEEDRLWLYGTDFGALPLIESTHVQAIGSDLTELRQALDR
jgi:hypothetical protein